MKYVISGPKNLKALQVHLPASKSISNRMLIMRALSNKRFDIQNLSDSDDTRTLLEALQSGSTEINIGHAGTAMRFLTAFYAVQHKKLTLTGSDRMQERPIGPLVNALRELGAGIRYPRTVGCPPLDIEGGLSQGGSLVVDGGISSQFISALMMIAPVLKEGLHIRLDGHVVSTAYIAMTLALMKEGGIPASFDGRNIDIAEASYDFGSAQVEADWSAASYWYMVAALTPGAVIRLPLLKEKSLQGDSALVSLFAPMGVRSRFVGDELVLEALGKVDRSEYKQDFTTCPDLAQTCATTLCAMGIPFCLTGTRTLRIKETDRIAALQEELGKLGFLLDADSGGDWISWDGKPGRALQNPVIETYHDHRMALAFAPLAIVRDTVVINDPMVVSKSYPLYYQDLEKAGFRVEKP